MGYTGAVGTMLMDEVAGVCRRVEAKFTGLWTDLTTVENELVMACQWLVTIQEEVDGLEVLV